MACTWLEPNGCNLTQRIICFPMKQPLSLSPQLTYVHNETNVGLQDLINQGHHFIQPLMMLLTFLVLKKKYKKWWKKSAKTQQDTQKCESNKHWTWTSKPTNMLDFWLDFTDSLTWIALVWLYHQPLYLWSDSWFLGSSVKVQGLWNLKQPYCNVCSAENLTKRSIVYYYYPW